MQSYCKFNKALLDQKCQLVNLVVLPWFTDVLGPRHMTFKNNAFYFSNIIMTKLLYFTLKNDLTDVATVSFIIHFSAEWSLVVVQKEEGRRTSKSNPATASMNPIDPAPIS